MDDAVVEHFRAQTVNRAEFLDWFNWFGLEMALSMVQLKFMYSEEVRERFVRELMKKPD